MSDEIVFVARALPFHSLGGMEIAAWDLACALAKLGHRVRMLTTAIPNQPAEFVEDDVRVVALVNTPPGRYSRRWRRALRAYFADHCLDSTQAVVSVSAGAFGLLSLKKRRPNIVFVLQAHGTSLGELISKWRSRRPRAFLTSAKNLARIGPDLVAYRRFDTLIAVGSRVYHDLSRPPLGRFTKSTRILQIDNGIDTDVFCPGVEDRAETRRELDIADDAPVIFTACRLHAQKGVDTALRAFARVHAERPDAVCVIAGDGPERAGLQALAGRLGITQRTIFTGALKRPSLARLYRAADVFLFLSRRVEGQPLNVLEALASGLPGVASAHLALADAPALTACPAGDADAAAAALVQWLEAQTTQGHSHLPQCYTLAHSAQTYAAELVGRAAFERGHSSS